jgi:hypothetical protein
VNYMGKAHRAPGNFENAQQAAEAGASLPGGVRLVTCATRTRLMGCTHSRGVSDCLRGLYRLSAIDQIGYVV